VYNPVNKKSFDRVFYCSPSTVIHMTTYPTILLVLLVRLIITALNTNGQTKKQQQATQNTIPVKRRYAMRRFLFGRKIRNTSTLFNGHYIDVKTLYIQLYNDIPSVSFIGELEATKAFAFIRETCGCDIVSTYQHTYFSHETQSTHFNNTIFVFANERMIELGNNYCHLLYGNTDYAWAKKMLFALADFRTADIIETPAVKQVIGFARQAEMN
jgi:hypothetical protein